MENNAEKNFSREEEQEVLEEILVNSRKTKNYMKWQLIITIALVVLPVLAIGFAIPIVMSSLSGVYGGALQGIK